MNRLCEHLSLVTRRLLQKMRAKCIDADFSITCKARHKHACQHLSFTRDVHASKPWLSSSWPFHHCLSAQEAGTGPAALPQLQLAEKDFAEIHKIAAAFKR
jgi:hypothetical protein